MYCHSINHLDKVFRLEYDRAKILLNNSKNGIDIEVKEHFVKRSSQANAYYWLFNNELAKFLDEAGLTYGEYNLPYTGELVHDINKQLFGVSTTTKMRKDEFCEYMTKLMSFWTEKTSGQFIMSESPYGYLEKVGYV